MGNEGGSRPPSVEPLRCGALFAQFIRVLRVLPRPFASPSSLAIGPVRPRPGLWPGCTLLDRLEPSRAVDHYGSSLH